MQSVRTFYKQYDELKGFFERYYNNKNKRLTYWPNASKLYYTTYMTFVIAAEF